MTCVSERSGSASRGMFRIAHHDPTSATIVATMTRYLFSAEKRMIRLIMALPSVPCVRVLGGRAVLRRRLGGRALLLLPSGRGRRGAPRRQRRERRAEARLGVHEEVRARHDAVALLEPRDHLDEVGVALTELDLARLELAVWERDEDDALRAGVDDRVGRDPHAAPALPLEDDVAEHLGAELSRRVRSEERRVGK